MSMNNAVPRADQPEYFSLRREDSQALLPLGQTLLVAPVHEIALLIDWPGQRLVAACTFFEEELLLLLPILRAWPGYVAYAHLLALLATGQVPERKQEEDIGHRYREALAKGTQDSMLAPLRSRLADPQQKLALFGLKLVSVYQEGVLLVQAPTPKQEAHQGGE